MENNFNSFSFEDEPGTPACIAKVGCVILELHNDASLSFKSDLISSWNLNMHLHKLRD
jgi:hypothetical protein